MILEAQLRGQAGGGSSQLADECCGRWEIGFSEKTLFAAKAAYMDLSRL